MRGVCIHIHIRIPGQPIPPHHASYQVRGPHGVPAVLAGEPVLEAAADAAEPDEPYGAVFCCGGGGARGSVLCIHKLIHIPHTYTPEVDTAHHIIYPPKPPCTSIIAYNHPTR